MIDQLDQKIKPFSEVKSIQVPNKGWINAIRTTLNMTLEQLGEKLNISRQAVNRLEDSESKGRISLNKLKDVAKVMNFKLVYALVPINDSIDELIEIKAEKLAREIVLRTNQNMKLEDQGIGDEKIDQTIKEVAAEIKREMNKSLWD